MGYFNLFPLYLLPLSKEKSNNIEFTFNDNQSITLNYTLFNNPYSKGINKDGFTAFKEYKSYLDNKKLLKENNNNNKLEIFNKR